MASLKLNVILFLMVLLCVVQVTEGQFWGWGGYCGFHCRRFHRRMFWRRMLNPWMWG